MLTPDAVKAKQFQATGRGAYRAEDVDGFFAEVSASYEQMFKENGELIKKISLLANKVESYKEEEDSLRKALISAQTLADKIVREAQESVAGTLDEAKADAQKLRAEAQAEAQTIVQNAKEEAEAVLLQSKKDADEILGTVNRKVTKESLEFEMLQKKASEFRNHLLSLYKEHLNVINAIPEYVEAEMETSASEPEQPASEPEPIAEPAAQETQPAVAAAEPEQEPAPVQETPAEEPQAAAPAEEEPEFEDISSSFAETVTETEPTAEIADEDGFTLDLSALEEEEEETEHSAKPAYAVIEEEDEEPDDDDDDESVSFKRFFKKK